MAIEVKRHRNKIIFFSLIICIIFFMVWFYIGVFDNGKESEQQLKQPEVPTLEETQKEYGSKLEAVNDIKEKRETTAPSV